MTESAVLFLVFNRPDTTERVFREIRRARPPRLYVAADGPRADRTDEASRCDEVREIATAVDWPCEVHTLFREENLGCKVAVSEGIDWFFENEERGIILEDDTLPDPTFFPYADELLDRYQDDRRIMSIGGTNIQGEGLPTEYSYCHSRFNLMWGWATWRRAWSLYDRSIGSWPRIRNTGWLDMIGSGSYLFRRRWTRILDRVHAGTLDTWDYQWIYTCWRENGLSVIPEANLIENIGFGDAATHTMAMDHVGAALRRERIAFPLEHPPGIELTPEVDDFIAKHWFGIDWWPYLRKGIAAKMSRIPGYLKHLSRRLTGSDGRAGHGLERKS